MHDIRYSAKRDELYVTNPFAQAILAFRGDSKGADPPIRIIQGPKTMLGSEDTLAIDDVNNEILIPSRDYVLVFPIDGNGDIAPLRVIKGAENGWRTGGGIEVDPIHNVLVTDGHPFRPRGAAGEGGGGGGRNQAARGEGGGGGEGETAYNASRDTIFIFDRTANGETKPLRVIRGPHTGIKAIRQMAMYPKGGYILIAQITDGGIATPDGAFIGGWSINDEGDVPPRWKIDAKSSNILTKPRGITLNPKNKEVIVSDMRLNAVLTFFVPEMF